MIETAENHYCALIKMALNDLSAMFVSSLPLILCVTVMPVLLINVGSIKPGTDGAF